ncbi:hypothetical protein CIPAW_16G048600 [Carya illinoinensis]|uniref:Uncharacterized protein n=1 Tax=Carya illinoinensis TaxID=32201 RepID=A0A8T1N6S4_CARIL|nr:hypothetical protein CIPAW_16G048600 [Carya illinoinensis]
MQPFNLALKRHRTSRNPLSFFTTSLSGSLDEEGIGETLGSRDGMDDKGLHFLLESPSGFKEGEAAGTNPGGLGGPAGPMTGEASRTIPVTPITSSTPQGNCCSNGSRQLQNHWDRDAKRARWRQHPGIRDHSHANKTKRLSLRTVVTVSSSSSLRLRRLVTEAATLAEKHKLADIHPRPCPRHPHQLLRPHQSSPPGKTNPSHDGLNPAHIPYWSKGLIGHAFMVCICTGNQNQMSFYPFVPHGISVLPNSPPDNVLCPNRPAETSLGSRKRGNALPLIYRISKITLKVVHAATRSHLWSSLSSPPIGYESILLTSLAYIVLSTRRCSPWRPHMVLMFTLFGFQSSHLNICYYHQDLHRRPLHRGSRPRFCSNHCTLLLIGAWHFPRGLGDFDFHDHRPAILIDQHPLWSNERFAHQYRCGPPPKFPPASPRSGIVHHFSSQDRYALTRTLLRRSWSISGATHKGIPPISFLAPYGFTSPLTRTHVRLLNPCFKIGRMGCPQVDARSTHDRGNDISTGMTITRVWAATSIHISPHPESIRKSAYTHSLTLFSKSFSSFSCGTCLLSNSHPYLALDGIYHPIGFAFPNNPTCQKRLVVQQGLGTTGLSPSPTPPSRGLRHGITTMCTTRWFLLGTKFFPPPNLLGTALPTQQSKIY